MKKIRSHTLMIGICLLLLISSCAEKSIAITFQNGECQWDGPKSVRYEEFTIQMNIVVEEPTTTGYVIVTLGDSKTMQDLEDWKTYEHPEWVNQVYDNGIMDAQSGTFSRTYHLDEPMAYQGGPIYLVCFQEDKANGNLKKIGAFGPIKVIQ